MSDDHHSLPAGPPAPPPPGPCSGPDNPPGQGNPYAPPGDGTAYPGPPYPGPGWPLYYGSPRPEAPPTPPFPGLGWFMLLTLVGLLGQLVVGLLGALGLMAFAGVDQHALSAHRLEGVAFTAFTGLLLAATLTWPGTVLAAARLTRQWRPGAFLLRRSRPAPLLLALLSGVALVPVALLLETLCARILPRSDNPIVRLMAQPHSSLATFLLFLTIVVGAPLGEELFFRGFCFRGLRDRYGAGVATVLVSVVFAAIHMNATGLIALGLVSAVLCWFVWRSGSVLPAMVLHATYNGLQFAMLQLTRVSPEELARQSQDTALGPLVWLAPLGLLVLLVSLWACPAGTDPQSPPSTEAPPPD